MSEPQEPSLSSVPDPFLPSFEEPAPTPPAQKRQARKTLVLWLLLIAMFVGIWMALDDKTPRPRPPACESQWSPGAIAVTVLPLGLVAAFLGYIAWVSRRTTRYNRAQEPASLAYLTGHFDEAVRLFRALEPHQGGHAARLYVHYHVASALFEKGDLDGALPEAIAAERGGKPFAGDIRVRSAILLAMIYGARGDLAAADQWAKEARARLPKVHDRIFVGALLRVAEALCQVRAGRYADGIATLDADAAVLAASLSLSKMRIVWLLRAFSLSQGESPRTVGQATPHLQLLRGTQGASLAYLGVRWPELRDFLDAHQPC